ncbi:hypothetical protein [Paenibacillus agricola]|uniref:Uncharacterized protein n=1 Tax=Paenibacillus agricola TaxID=2716264 RepID=A0ABX0J7G5_9BACL|nr:hypothetical protein [Paenibacillus agricola]NHN31746.1 hypothetical protein [Paenibacillus agricola]
MIIHVRTMNMVQKNAELMYTDTMEDVAYSTESLAELAEAMLSRLPRFKL